MVLLFKWHLTENVFAQTTMSHFRLYRMKNNKEMVEIKIAAFNVVFNL